LKHILQNFNLFRSTQQPEGDDNGYQLKNQLISTRLFICLLSISLIILLVYTSQVQVTHIIIIDSPSLEVYSSLYEKYAEVLTCPCTNIAITQQEFISLTPTFHQICDSDFVNTRWPTGIDASMGSNYVYNRDFRFRGFSAFTVLISICSLSKTNIANALIDFNSTTFISKNVLPENILIAQMNASIDSYTTSLAYAFERSFQTIRDTTQANGLVSATLSSITFRIVLNNNMSAIVPIDAISPRYKLYNQSSCSCHDSATCSEQAYIYTTDFSNIPIYPIPGLLIGCYGFEAMMQSNLLCFFNQTCVDDLRTAMNYTYNFTTRALDPSKLVYFNLNSTIQSIMEKIMVQQWIHNVSYVNYYNQCRPIYCRRTYEQKNDVIYIITTLFALIGGLTTILQLIVPRFVRLVRKLLLKRQQRRIRVSIVT
jgi:hypothetical protein